MAGTEFLKSDKFYNLFEIELKRMKGRMALTGHGPTDLWGLSLSGSGIRAATFALGVMQALAANNKINKFDYLSTVSGGGYIGTSWTWHASKQNNHDFPYQPGAGRPNNLVTYLREHGNYLTPGNGLNAASMIGITIRAIFLNLIVWLPLLMVFFMVIGNPESPVLCHKIDGWCLSSFDLFGVLAAVLALWFAGACLAYSWATAFMNGKYDWRLSFEKWMGILLTMIVALGVLILVPFVSDALSVFRGKLLEEAGGVLPLLAGLASGAWTFSRSKNESGSSLPTNIIASVAATLILFGFLVTAYKLANSNTLMRLVEDYLCLSAGLFGLLLLAFSIAFGWICNSNLISLHRFYRDRLMELYMPDLETAQVTANAPITYHKPANGADKANIKDFFSSASYDNAPYHLINTNVLLNHSQHSRHKFRGGDRFILSPLYCGSSATGWQTTERFVGGTLSLSTAMAISGAAANPNTGASGKGPTRSRAVSLLMALLNIRLGYFVRFGPDAREASWYYRANHFVTAYYELFGNFHEKAKFLQLSDGGHYENLGLYELVRRKCKVIVATDAGCDAETSFADLQASLLRIEQDFGVTIEISDEDFSKAVPRPADETKYPKGVDRAEQGFLVGRIDYRNWKNGNAAQDEMEHGYFLMAKTAFVEKNTDLQVKANKNGNPDFPDQTTADQFFDEEQFEAYRRLGKAIGENALSDPLVQLKLR